MNKKLLILLTLSAVQIGYVGAAASSSSSSGDIVDRARITLERMMDADPRIRAGVEALRAARAAGLPVPIIPPHNVVEGAVPVLERGEINHGDQQVGLEAAEDPQDGVFNALDQGQIDDIQVQIEQNPAILDATLLFLRMIRPWVRLGIPATMVSMHIRGISQRPNNIRMVAHAVALAAYLYMFISERRPELMQPINERIADVTGVTSLRNFYLDILATHGMHLPLPTAAAMTPGLIGQVALLLANFIVFPRAPIIGAVASVANDFSEPIATLAAARCNIL